MRHHSHRVALALSITAWIASGLAAARAEPPRAAGEDPAARAAAEAGDPVYRQAGRELARLDERLGLHTVPDGSPLWPPRLAAAIEHRMASQAESDEHVPSRGLLRRLDADLRALGADGPLAGPPELQPADAGSARGRSWRERLDALLVTARLLNRKLDAAEQRQAERSPGTGDDRIAARSAPANDACGAAGPIGLGTFTGSTLGATNDGSATCGSSTSSSDVWYRYTATEDGNVSFDTFNSSFDTVLSLHSGCPATGTELGCSDDADGTTGSALDLVMTAGDEVWVRIAGFGGDAGDYTLHVAETGGLSGTVTRRDTGAPISGARVGVLTTYGYFLTSALTGADGTYQIGGLMPDTYVSATTSAGFIRQDYDGVDCPPFSGCTGAATPITVGPSVTEGIDFSLTPAGSISGTVTDQGSAEPLQGYAYLYAAPGGAYRDSVYIDSDGEYTLDGLEAGSYYVKAEAGYHQSEVYDDVPCAPCDVTTGTQIPVASGASVTGIDFALDRLGTVEGTVVDQSTSDPIPNQEVDLLTAQGFIRRSSYTKSDGTYEIQAVQPGTYVVRVLAAVYRDELYDDVPCQGGCSYSSATPVSVSLGAATSGIDFGLIRLGRISGTVTEAGFRKPSRRLLGRPLRQPWVLLVLEQLSGRRDVHELLPRLGHLLRDRRQRRPPAGALRRHPLPRGLHGDQRNADHRDGRLHDLGRRLPPRRRREDLRHRHRRHLGPAGRGAHREILQPVRVHRGERRHGERRDLPEPGARGRNLLRGDRRELGLPERGLRRPAVPGLL